MCRVVFVGFGIVTCVVLLGSFISTHDSFVVGACLLIVFIGPKAPSTDGRTTDATDEPEDALRSLYA